MHPDHEKYIGFSLLSRLNKSIETLVGILEGIMAVAVKRQLIKFIGNKFTVPGIRRSNPSPLSVFEKQMKYKFITIGIVNVICTIFIYVGLSFAQCDFGANSENGLTAQGTLVITVPTKEGLLVCADKREFNKVRGATDNDVKVFKLSSRAGFALSGVSGILSRSNLSPIFDIKKITTDYFVDKDANKIWMYLDDFRYNLKNEYLKYLSKGGPAIEEGGKPPDYTITVLQFFYLDASNRINVEQIEFRYKKDEPSFINTNRNDKTKLCNIVPRIDGQIEVTKQILDENDRRFDDIRAEPEIDLMLFSRINVDTVTIKDAEIFVARLIQVTNQRHHLISSTPSMVSLNYDCALLNPSNGFKWVTNNANANKYPVK